MGRSVNILEIVTIISLELCKTQTSDVLKLLYVVGGGNYGSNLMCLYKILLN